MYFKYLRHAPDVVPLNILSINGVLIPGNPSRARTKVAIRPAVKLSRIKAHQQIYGHKDRSIVSVKRYIERSNFSVKTQIRLPMFIIFVFNELFHSFRLPSAND